MVWRLTSAQVVVSVVTNLPKATGFAGIVTMQDMTGKICSSVDIGTEGQLLDTRDEAAYYVGKMKDGKCWMLQNLALGSTTETMSLTSSDSNVTSNWTLPKAFISPTERNSSDVSTAVWNFGKWVLATPLLTKSCGSYIGINDLSSCIKVGFVDVSDSTKFEPIYLAATGNWNGANATDNTLVAVNCTSWSGSGTSKTCTAGTYDAHYLVGNYYSWGAAVAGTGTGITSLDASGSICPKGWKLPAGSTSNSNNDFYKLSSAYGVNSNLSGIISGITYNIVGSPLRFVRSGDVEPGSYVYNAGLGGNYWSSRATSDAGFAQYLYFGNLSVNTFYQIPRSVGFSVRCITE